MRNRVIAGIGGAIGLGLGYLAVSAGDPTKGALPIFHFHPNEFVVAPRRGFKFRGAPNAVREAPTESRAEFAILTVTKDVRGDHRILYRVVDANAGHGAHDVRRVPDDDQ